MASIADPGILSGIQGLVTVSKLGQQHQFIFSWQGKVLADDGDELVLEAHWTGTGPRFLGYTVFEVGDRFLERYYRSRWFSVWQVFSQRSGRVKGWYCNICQPIEIEGDQIRFVDMELDLFVYPDGRYLVLDEDELEQKVSSPVQKEQARQGLAEVLEWVERRAAPFERLGPPRRIEPFWE